jgi:hypothetical protein
MASRTTSPLPKEELASVFTVTLPIYGCDVAL